MITKNITFDHSILENGHIQVREVTRIMEDGAEISKSFKRHVVIPGDDPSKEDTRTVQLMEAIYTPESVADCLDKLRDTNEEGAITGLKRIINRHGLSLVKAAIDQIIIDLDLIEENENAEIEAAKKKTFMEKLRTWDWDF